jgi:hypothetical protein
LKLIEEESGDTGENEVIREWEREEKGKSQRYLAKQDVLKLVRAHPCHQCLGLEMAWQSWRSSLTQPLSIESLMSPSLQDLERSNLPGSSLLCVGGLGSEKALGAFPSS